MTAALAPPVAPVRLWSDRAIALAVAVVTFLLVYGVELSEFGLSIDEEIASFHEGEESLTWLQQGRWGMALVSLLLPPVEAVPLVSTALFGAGLLYATWRAVGDFELGRLSGVLFAAVHVGFPVWLHVVQFSTLAPGVGLGLAAAALGASWAVRGGHLERALAVLMIAFATGVYQTLGIYAVLYAVLHAHAVAARSPGRPDVASMLRTLAVAAAVWGAGVLVYWLVQKASLAALSTQMAYVGSFIQLEQLQRDPAGASRSIFDFLRSLLGGRHPIYIGWGAGILTLMWLGLAPWEWLARLREAIWSRWSLALLVAAIGFCIVAVPAVLSIGALPVRAQVVLPLLAAWLASRIGLAEPVRIVRAGAVLLAGYFVVVSASISATLLHTDRVVHEFDAVLTQNLVRRIRAALPAERAPGPMPMTLVGTTHFPASGGLRKAEVFGTSFYEHDHGNVYRVMFLMQLQGATHMAGVPLESRPDLLPAVRAMPSWPAEGSVAWVKDTMVIKLSEPNAWQTAGR